MRGKEGEVESFAIFRAIFELFVASLAIFLWEGTAANQRGRDRKAWPRSQFKNSLVFHRIGMFRDIRRYVWYADLQRIVFAARYFVPTPHWPSSYFCIGAFSIHQPREVDGGLLTHVKFPYYLPTHIVNLIRKARVGINKICGLRTVYFWLSRCIIFMTIRQSVV